MKEFVASRYMGGGRQVGGPPLKSTLSRLAGLSLYWFGRVGTRDATNSFKAQSDDIRSSLSYKLKRILRFKAARVLTHDPFVTVDPDLSPLEEVLAQSDLLIIGAPHGTDRDLDVATPVVDISNLREVGVRV